jgi:hypothetical protein
MTEAVLFELKTWSGILIHFDVERVCCLCSVSRMSVNLHVYPSQRNLSTSLSFSKLAFCSDDPVRQDISVGEENISPILYQVGPHSNMVKHVFFVSHPSN